MDEKQDRFDRDQERFTAVWEAMARALNDFADQCAEVAEKILQALECRERKND